VWVLSVLIIFTISILFDGFRIFDYIFNNFSKKEMTITNYSYDSSSRIRSITIEGVIDKKKVYFSRFDENIDKLNSLYPKILLKNEERFVINVLKFKHSNIVMLIDDDELLKWKREKILSSIYIFSSLLIICVNNLLNRKK
jgi:hypothetical protein